MSKTYKTSDRMKTDILRVAKGFFCEHGYNKTTYQMISDELGISKSAICYHFNTKPWIIYNLCMGVIKEVYVYVKGEFADREDFNYYKYHCAAQLIIYRALMKNESDRALYFNKNHTSIWVNEKIDIVERYYKEIKTDFKKESDNNSIRATAVMSSGAKLSLINRFMQNPGESSIDDCCYNLLYLVGMLSELDKATILSCIEFAFDFANKHNPQINKLFA